MELKFLCLVKPYYISYYLLALTEFVETIETDNNINPQYFLSCRNQDMVAFNFVNDVLVNRFYITLIRFLLITCKYERTLLQPVESH